jgi:LSD1 subclass zinc finger protein
MSEGAEDAIAAILGIEGLSEEEKRQLIEEQLRIMEEIESARQTAADRAADAFEQRSYTAAVAGVDRHRHGGGGATTTTVDVGRGRSARMHGQEETQQAIQDGTAVLVECLSCHNWMHVTAAAKMMFCPVCQTVSPVEAHTADMTEAELAQLQEDAKLAEMLQKEEYDAAERSERRRAQPAKQPQQQQQQEQGWMEWLGFGSPAPAPPPPGSPERNATEEIRFTESQDSADGLLDGRPRARVARQQPLFACVTDSVKAATHYAVESVTALQQDEEGNVHGVDSSGLLGSGGDDDDRRESKQPYARLPSDHPPPK